MSKKKKNIPRSTYEIYRSIRKDWGNIKPYTRVENSKKYKKPKHIKLEQEKYYEE